MTRASLKIQILQAGFRSDHGAILLALPHMISPHELAELCAAECSKGVKRVSLHLLHLNKLRSVYEGRAPSNLLTSRFPRAGYCPTQSLLLKFRAQPAYADFIKQWNLPAYFSIRWGCAPSMGSCPYGPSLDSAFCTLSLQI